MLKKLVSTIIIIILIASLFSACSDGNTVSEDGEATVAKYISETEWYAANENNYVEQCAQSIIDISFKYGYNISNDFWELVFWILKIVSRYGIN